MATMGRLTKKDFDYINEKYQNEDMDKLVSSGLLTNFKYVSGSRLQMFGNHVQQSICLNKPETPRSFTGYEKVVGKYSDGYKEADNDYEIVAKISRFSNYPNMIYLLVLKRRNMDFYDIVKVSHYEKVSDNHGYSRPFTDVDLRGPGETISKGEIIYRSNSLDEFNNYRYGTNAKVAFISAPENEEDAIIASESFVNKNTFNLVVKTEYTINKNDILLNIYGDNKEYKCFPNVGEHVDDSGILFASRKLDKKNMASDLTDNALAHIYHDDNKFGAKGQVVDIDIKINDIEELKSDAHRDQLFEVYSDQFRYNQMVYECLSRIVNNKNNVVSSRLEQELFNATNYINPNVSYSSNSGKFEFAYITIYTSYETALWHGFKLTNRCGGKGIIGKILPDEYMPVDEHGVRAELIVPTPSIVSRANISQSYEQAFNYCSDCIVRNMKKMKVLDEQLNYLVKYLTMINEEYGMHVKDSLRLMNTNEKKEFLETIFNNGIYLYNPPFHNALGFKKLREIKRKFKIKTSYIRMKREYRVPEEIVSLYRDKETIDSIKHLDENYIWDMDNKNSFGYEELVKSKDQKNPMKLSKKDYEANKWMDDYIWGNHKTGALSENTDEDLDYLLHNMNMLSDKIDPDKITLKEFNELNTKIYKKNENTLIREYRSKKKVVIADIYYLVLKHIPDNGFSARYLGNTTPLGIPNKSFNKTEMGRPFSETCNKFSDMDNCNLKRRCNPEKVTRFLATMSTHPLLREQLSEMLLFQDPLKLHDLDISDSEIKDTVTAKSLKAYLGVLGLTVLDDDEPDPYEFLDDIDYVSLEDLFKNHIKVEHPNEQ